jgi:hypothetical protein
MAHTLNYSRLKKTKHQKTAINRTELNGNLVRQRKRIELTLNCYDKLLRQHGPQSDCGSEDAL